MDLNKKLNNRWNIWFHSINEKNWSIDSYQLITHIETYEDLIYLLKKIDNLNNGLYFIMKAGISPIYEDCQNINGGYWSFRVNKKNAYEMWISIIYHLCVKEYSEEEEELYKNINGISISPKVNNSIIKIWNKNFDLYTKDNISTMIDNVKNEEIFYLRHEIKQQYC